MSSSFIRCPSARACPACARASSPGDARLIQRNAQLHQLHGGVAVPYPILAASTALWRDEAHVEEGAPRYRANFEAAAEILGEAVRVRAPGRRLLSVARCRRRRGRPPAGCGPKPASACCPAPIWVGPMRAAVNPGQALHPRRARLRYGDDGCGPAPDAAGSVCGGRPARRLGAGQAVRRRPRRRHERLRKPDQPHDSPATGCARIPAATIDRGRRLHC